MNPQFWWYVARASGIVAWLMLTASVLWGIVLSTRAFPRTRRPAWLLDLHRWLGGLTLSFVAIHIAALVADNFTPFGLGDVTIPFASSWRPAPVALGVVSMWLLVAVQLTSLGMRRLPRKFWRAVHLSSYGTFVLATLHGAFAGTDRNARLFILTGALSVAVVVWSAGYRWVNRDPHASTRAARTRTAATRTAPAARPDRTARPARTAPAAAPAHGATWSASAEGHRAAEADRRRPVRVPRP